MNKPFLALAALAIAMSAPGGAQTATPRLTLVQELRIDGAAEDLSGLSTSVWVGNDGRMAFLNAPDVRFVFFDRTGKRIGTFGGPGEGPGEFPPDRGGLQSGTLGDTMWVYASRQRRFTLIGPDLKLVRTMLLPPRDSSILGLDPMALLPGNRILGSAMFGRESDSQSQLLDRTQDTLIVMTATGAIERRLGGRPHDFTNARARNSSGRFESVRTPFVQRPQLFATRAGDRFGTLTSTITTATGGTLSVTVVRSTGERVFSRSYPFTSGAIPKRVIDSVYERQVRSYQTAEYAELRRVLRAKMPAVYPPVTVVELATDGSVWIERESPTNAPRELFVLGPAGDVRGTAVFPRSSLRLRHASQTHVWAIETDADGFVSIVRFRVGQ